MVVDIEVTRRPNGRFVARALHIPGVVVEATSRDAALEQVRDALIARQREGVEIVRLDLGDVGGALTLPAGEPRQTLAQARGLLASRQTAPSDEEVARWLDERRSERFGL